MRQWLTLVAKPGFDAKGELIMQVKTIEYSDSTLYVFEDEDAACEFAEFLWSDNPQIAIYQTCAGKYGNAIECVEAGEFVQLAPAQG